MKSTLSAALLVSAPALLCANAALAQGFSWEGEIEIGNEQVVSSDAAANEIRNTYAIIELGGSYAFDTGTEIFTNIIAESLTGATSDRTFDDMGAYIDELGVRFGFGPATVSIGKAAPTFGSAWDDAAGFFGGTLAEDYELGESISILADVELGTGVLSFGAFYTDDTGLSRSVGFDRGRNTTAAGGAGNTGKLDNFAIQWRQDLGENTFYQVGARHLSQGVGDVDDEQGFVAALGHSFDNGLALFGEVSSFSNFGGGANDATFATLNAAYGVGSTTFSGTYARRDLDAAGETDLFSIAAEHEFQNGWVLGGALAHMDDSGVSDKILGVNLVIPLGS
jgi:hypothetical protein